MTEAEVIDRINSTIKKNGKKSISGDEINFVLKAVIQLISDSAGTISWGDIEGTIADQLDLLSALNAKENTANKGTANGYVPLNSSTLIDSSYLPSYVDDVLEFANLASFPGTGESGKIYVSIATNLSYRWSGSVYVRLDDSVALGETSATAYRGDRGKIAYDHSQSTGNPHGTTATDVDALKRDGSNANANVDLGANGLDAKFIKIKGTAGNGHLNMKHQSSGATAGGSESVLYADNSGNPKWKNDGNAVQNVMLENSPITGATKTKITYDAKGLVTSGADATTADIADSSNKRYVTDANLTVIGNTSGTNTGDQTFIVPRVQNVTSSATVTPTSGNDIVTITAQAQSLTLANPTGNWSQGQDFIVRIKDNGTARSITWDANYRAIGLILPTTTVAGKTTYVGLIYNSTDSRWDAIGVTTEI